MTTHTVCFLINLLCIIWTFFIDQNQITGFSMTEENISRLKYFVFVEPVFYVHFIGKVTNKY